MRITLCSLFTSLTCLLLLAVGVSACHDDNNDVASHSKEKQKRRIVFCNSIGGPGDNGYNDIILESEMQFVMKHPDVSVLFYQPDSLGDAELVYEMMTRVVDDADSILIVLNGSDYHDLVRNYGDIVVPDSVEDLHVLIFEDDGVGLPAGVTSFYIERYGMSYVAGRMASGVNAMVIGGMENDPFVQDAVEGFADGYAVAGQYECPVFFLANDLSGFNADDKAMRLCDSVVKAIIPEEIRWTQQNDYVYPGLCIFSVAGGSNVGVYRYVDAIPNNWLVNAIGIDKDWSQTSLAIPMSIEIPISELITKYLDNWIKCEPWPEQTYYGLSEIGHGSITMSGLKNYNIFYWMDPETTDPCNSEIVNDSLLKFFDEGIEMERKRLSIRDLQ